MIFEIGHWFQIKLSQWLTCKVLVKNKKACRAVRSGLFQLFLLIVLTYRHACLLRRGMREQTQNKQSLNQWLWRPKHIFWLSFVLCFLKCNLMFPGVCVCVCAVTGWTCGCVHVGYTVCSPSGVVTSDKNIWCNPDFPLYYISCWDINQNYNFNNPSAIRNEIWFTSNELWILHCRTKSIKSLKS